MIRELKLRELGYDSYNDYLRSPAWRDVKRRYREAYPMICMCGSTKVEIHHKTYDRVGKEDLDDLVALCRDCHEQAHLLEAAGVIGLDLNGFYYDLQRALDYAPVREAREAKAQLEREQNRHLQPAVQREAARRP